jgi:hypothetical protein
MAHKAKSKKKADTAPETKTTLPTKTNPKRKTTQQTKSTPGIKSEETPEMESTQERKTNQGKKSLLSCSLTEPVIRVLSNPTAKASAPHEKAQHGKAANTNPNFRIFHKREKNRNNADIIGTRALTTWKKSSGRSKSWAVCRRLKLSREDLELLIQSKTCPVSLGWRFSSVISPAIFVRSQGVRVYEQLEKKTKGLSRGKGFDDLEDECGAEWPLPRGTAFKGRKWRQEIEHRGGGEVAFLRLTFDHGHVSMTHEAFLEEIILSTPSESTKYPGATILADLVVIRLLRNESHADVYLVQNPSNPSRFYHAHAFLTDVSGNWSTFSKRKMDRLRKSQGFYAETVQHGREIIIMDIDLKADKEFCMKNMLREFPPLPGIGKTLFHSSSFIDSCGADDQSLELKPATKLKKNRISYAAVVGRGRRKQHAASNHRAYKAWEERKGTGKKMVAPDKAPAREPKLSLPEKKIGGFKTWVGRRKIQRVSDCNRLLLEVGMLTCLCHNARLGWG